MEELIRTIENTIKATLPFQTNLLDQGIVEIFEERIGTHSLTLGMSFETHPEHNAPVYIFNLFADEDYINIDGEYEENAIGKELFIMVADKWNEFKNILRR